MSAGMKSSRITPLLGLAFLISAITPAWPLSILARSAPTKSRVSTRLSASRRMSAKGRRFLAAATSSTFTSQIFFRMSDMAWLLGAVGGGAGSGRELLRVGHEFLQLGQGRAAGQGLLRAPQAVLQGLGHVGRVQRGAGVQADDVARRAPIAVLTLQHFQ